MKIEHRGLQVGVIHDVSYRLHFSCPLACAKDTHISSQYHYYHRCIGGAGLYGCSISGFANWGGCTQSEGDAWAACRSSNAAKTCADTNGYFWSGCFNAWAEHGAVVIPRDFGDFLPICDRVSVEFIANITGDFIVTPVDTPAMPKSGVVVSDKYFNLYSELIADKYLAGECPIYKTGKELHINPARVHFTALSTSFSYYIDSYKLPDSYLGITYDRVSDDSLSIVLKNRPTAVIITMPQVNDSRSRDFDSIGNIDTDCKLISCERCPETIETSETRGKIPYYLSSESIHRLCITIDGVIFEAGERTVLLSNRIVRTHTTTIECPEELRVVNQGKEVYEIQEPPSDNETNSWRRYINNLSSFRLYIIVGALIVLASETIGRGVTASIIIIMMAVTVNADVGAVNIQQVSPYAGILMVIEGHMFIATLIFAIATYLTSDEMRALRFSQTLATTFSPPVAAISIVASEIAFNTNLRRYVTDLVHTIKEECYTRMIPSRPANIVSHSIGNPIHDLDDLEDDNQDSINNIFESRAAYETMNRDSCDIEFRKKMPEVRMVTYDEPVIITTRIRVRPKTVNRNHRMMRRNCRNLKGFVLYDQEYEAMKDELKKLDQPTLVAVYANVPRVHGRDVYDLQELWRTVGNSRSRAMLESILRYKDPWHHC